MTQSLPRCTATLDDKTPCKRPSDARYQRGVKVNSRWAHSGPICQACYKRFKDDAKRCRLKDCNKEARSAAGYCRPHEHIPLRDLTLQERNQLWQLIADSVKPDYQITGCWTYTGATPDGYSRLHLGTKIKRGLGTWLGHRLTYHLVYSGHGQGRGLDHLCRNTLCLNPLHLHPETDKENGRLRERRANDDWAPWHEHSNWSKLTPALLWYANKHGLPLRPWRETRNDDGTVNYSLHADKDPDNIAMVLVHLDGSKGPCCAGTGKVCCQ